MRHKRGAFVAVAGLGLLWLAACSDRGYTEPRFDRPVGSIIGLDETKRLPASRELGGNAAMAEMSRQFGPASLESSDTLQRTIAEWQSRQGGVSGPSAARMWEGVEEYDGDYYIWSNGESYSPAHKAARIYNLVAQASRVGSTGPIDIRVTFKFDGHKASNDAQWTLKNSNEDVLRTRPLGNFGAQTDPFLGLSIFGARGWAAFASEQDLGCDVKVTGDTRPKAWYEGYWDENGISVGISPSGPGGSISLSRGVRGQVETSKDFSTQFTCPPSNPGGDGGYGGDDCWVCQQWFQPLGEGNYLEWWECNPSEASQCDAT